MTNTEIDTLIAEKVLGWKRIELPESAAKVFDKTWMYDKREGDYGYNVQKPPPSSTSIVAAMDVLDRFLRYDLTKDGPTCFSVGLSHAAGHSVYKNASTLPMAICLAAFAAKEITVRQNEEDDGN